MSRGHGPRELAATAIADVIARGRSLDESLAQAVPKLAHARDDGLVRELAFGTLRWRFRLEALLNTLLKRPLKKRDTDIHALLLIGLYQLIYLRVPDHAAVAETVGAVTKLGKGWARGLVNGTLRGFLRNRETLVERLDEAPESQTAHPAWLLRRFEEDWPADWRGIVEANNRRPPMTLRVNRRRGEVDDSRDELTAAGFDSHSLAIAKDALILNSPVDVEYLPGFAEGRLSVQDAGAQLAADALDLGADMRVLDACAAPGGKTGHILERAPGLAECVALDISAGRLDRLRENLDRLGVDATIRAGDALDPPAWWDQRPFDRILLDAPCSAAGVIRRHPDIKSLRRADDIERLSVMQAQMLDALWPLLNRGGKLVYVTCSVLRIENEAPVAAFLNRTTNAHARPLPFGRAAGAGRQILPGEDDMDGFFYACIEKTPA